MRCREKSRAIRRKRQLRAVERDLAFRRLCQCIEMENVSGCSRDRDPSRATGDARYRAASIPLRIYADSFAEYGAAIVTKGPIRSRARGVGCVFGRWRSEVLPGWGHAGQVDDADPGLAKRHD